MELDSLVISPSWTYLGGPLGNHLISITQAFLSFRKSQEFLDKDRQILHQSTVGFRRLTRSSVVGYPKWVTNFLCDWGDTANSGLQTISPHSAWCRNCNFYNYDHYLGVSHWQLSLSTWRGGEWSKTNSKSIIRLVLVERKIPGGSSLRSRKDYGLGGLGLNLALVT